MSGDVISRGKTDDEAKFVVLAEWSNAQTAA
jgi:hypothetical protein